MNTAHLSAMLAIGVLVGAPSAADRKWQTGTWTDMGVKRTPWVSDARTKDGHLASPSR
jgi:hypothetical protein